MCLSAEEKRAYFRNWRAAHPDKVSAYRKRWQAKHPEKHRAAQRKWRLANPEKTKASDRKKRYGIDGKTYLALLSAQAGACAICGDDIRYRATVDHNHLTGMVRGLLCNGCNIGLGRFRDDPIRLHRAADYIEKWMP